MGVRKGETNMTRWLAVRGYQCDHGHTIPVQGISKGAKRWYGLFCVAGICRPSWRAPDDPWLVAVGVVSEEEARYRMELCAQMGIGIAHPEVPWTLRGLISRPPIPPPQQKRA